MTIKKGDKFYYYLNKHSKKDFSKFERYYTSTEYTNYNECMAVATKHAKITGTYWGIEKVNKENENEN